MYIYICIWYVYVCMYIYIYVYGMYMYVCIYIYIYMMHYDACDIFKPKTKLVQRYDTMKATFGSCCGFNPSTMILNQHIRRSK